MIEGTNEIDLLISKVVGGDRAATNQLLMILRPLVVRYCRSRLGTEHGDVLADDVAQEVCLAVLKALPTYTDQGKPFLAFVYGIAAHKVVDAHRSASRDRSEPTDRREAQSFMSAVSDELRALLELLPPKQREILELRVAVGLSAEETAERVGTTAGAVRVAQHRAVAKLRGILGVRGRDLDPAEEGEGLVNAVLLRESGSAVLALPRTDTEVETETWLRLEEERSDWIAAPLTGLPELDSLFSDE